MMMFAQALLFLLDTLLGLFTLAVLLRFYLQLVGAPFHNPISQAVVTMTNFAVRPVRRFVPGLGGLDLSTLLLALLAQIILQFATLWLKDFPVLVAAPVVYGAVVGLAVLALARISVYIVLYAVLIQAVLSWVNPHTPAAPVLDRLTRPFLAPLRGVSGASSGIDFSPLIVFLVAQLVLMLVLSPLEFQLLRLL